MPAAFGGSNLTLRPLRTLRETTLSTQSSPGSQRKSSNPLRAQQLFKLFQASRSQRTDAGFADADRRGDVSVACRAVAQIKHRQNFLASFLQLLHCRPDQVLLFQLDQDVVGERSLVGKIRHFLLHFLFTFRRI